MVHGDHVERLHWRVFRTDGLRGRRDLVSSRIPSRQLLQVRHFLVQNPEYPPRALREMG